MADSNVPRHSLSATANGPEPVRYHGLEEQTGDYWSYGRLTNSFERVGSATARKTSTLVIPDDGQEAPGEGGGQGSYEDFFQSLVDSVTPQESRSRHEGNPVGFTDDDQQQSLTPHSPALIYDPDDSTCSLGQPTMHIGFQRRRERMSSKRTTCSFVKFGTCSSDKTKSHGGVLLPLAAAFHNGAVGQRSTYSRVARISFEVSAAC
jgi:hypothetical protein